MAKSLESYKNYLQRFPAPGGGGAHMAIYGAGCHGFRAGLPMEQVIDDVIASIPPGGRVVPDSEVEEGVRNAYADLGRGDRQSTRVEPLIRPGLLQSLISEGSGATEEDFRRRSPVPLDWDPNDAAQHVLEALYKPEELLFIGDDNHAGKIGETIRPRDEWITVLNQLSSTGVPGPWPKIMVNSLTGEPGPTKSGEGTSLRADSCIASHRIAVAEFDNMSIDDQLAFWMAVPHLPIAALIKSGKKSIHGWLKVDCEDAEEWEREIEQNLFPGFLTPLGVDPACRNQSRLSRMPGHLRSETGQTQECIYLAPGGKAVQE